MKKRMLALFSAVYLTVSMAGGCISVSAAEEKKDEVIVTMPVTSEPEAGFDPAYGWGPESMYMSL